MHSRVKRWGNSLAVRIPKAFALEAGLAPDTEVDVSVRDGNVIVADTDEAARRLFTSVQMRFVGMVRNERGLLQPPIDDINSYWTASEQVHASRMLTCSFVGSPATVATQLRAFVARTGIDELIVASAIYDQHAKFRSFELLRSLSF
ncbi:MAG: AbrB/MazE/SpoVT family DNA-binding domain-containing protein [Aestuariivirga sp.]